MDLKPYLDLLVRVFSVVKAATNDNKWVVSLLGLLTSLQSSPQLLDWLGQWFQQAAAVPGGALALAVSPDDPALIAAYNMSPAVQEWSLTQEPEGIPGDAEAIGIGSVLAIIKFLPELLALYKAWKA